MKNLLCFLLILCGLINNSEAGITVALNQFSGNAKICENNSTEPGEISITSAIPGTNLSFPITFTLTLDATVYYPGQAANPVSLPYPACGDATTLNPVKITLNSIAIGSNPSLTLSTGSMSYNASNNFYSYPVTISGSSAVSSVKIVFDYSVYLDCSLIPATPPPSNLNQYVLGINAGIAGGNTSSVTTNVPIPFIADNLVPAQMPAVPFTGNYAQQTDMIFEYKNEGNTDINIDIMDFADLCGTGYTVISREYVTTGNYQPLSTLPPLATNINIPANGVLYLKQTIQVMSCLANVCNNNDRKIRFVWKCHNAPAANCQNCQHEYITPFNFVFEEPHFSVVAVAPFFNEDDISCADPSTPSDWKIKLTNTSLLTTLQSVHLHFQNPEYATGFTYLKSSDISALNGFPSYPWNNASFGIANITASGSGAPCSNATTVSSFDINTGEIPPGGYYEFTLPFYKCCIAPYTSNSLAENTEWNSYLNTGKYFNQWTVMATAEDKCGYINDVPDAVANSLIYPGTNGGISSHAVSATKDIDLFISHQFAGTDLDISPGNTYGTTSQETMTFGGMLGDDFDKQALGIVNTATTMDGILRVRLHLKKGLVIADFANDVSLTYTASATPIPVLGVYSDNPQNGASPPQCAEGVYDYYFKLDNTISITDLFNTGVFHFLLTSCCDADGTTPYDAAFSLLSNSCGASAFPAPASGILYANDPVLNFWDKCWIPLGKKGFHKNIHCPGCKAPGIVVDKYDMYRNSFGFEDANNDGMADVNSSGQPIPVTPGSPYLANNRQCMNLGAAILGDEVTDRLTAHFQEGDHDRLFSTSNCNERGYTYNQQTVDDGTCTGVSYSDMLSAPSHNIILKALQLYRKAENGGCNKMALKIKDATLYIDDLPGTIASGTFEDGALFNISSPVRRTLYKITFNQTTFTDPNSPYYKEDATGVDLEQMFTFHTDDLCNNLAGYGTATAYTTAPVCSLQYLENQQYRLIVNYEINGNTFNASLTPSNWDDIELKSEIMNRMWFTGGVSNHGFELNNANGLYWDYKGQMPNSTVALSLLPAPLKLGTSTYCPSGCAIADQSSLGDMFRFFCEPRGNLFRFYSSDFLNYSTMGNQADGCGMAITTYTNCYTGRNNYTYYAGGTCALNIGKDIFPYEFRAPKLLPHLMHYEPVAASGLYSDFSNHSINASTKQAEVFSYYRIPGSSTFFNTPSLTFAAPSGIQNNTANIEFNQSAAGTLHLLTQQAFPPSPSKLWVSDNYFQQATTIYLDLACPEPSSPKNIALNMAASIVQFGVAAGNGFTAPDVALYSYQAPATCDVTGADASSLNGGSWSYPNPVNLSLGLSTPSITATEQKVCWDFTMSNPVTAGSTPAYNVFMQAPVLLPPYNTVLTNWELTFDYKGNSYSYPAPLQGGGIFTLFPTPPMPSAPDFVNFAAGVSMVQNGKLCAKYNECVKPDLDLTLNWGWNCTADYNSACLINFAETLHVKPADPNIQLSAVTPPASVTLCSDNMISVQFKNMDAGTAYPTLVSFGSNTTGFTPVSVTAVNCNNPSASASLTLAYDANNHIIFPLTAGNLHDLGYATTASPGNDGMKQGDCIELQITFTPTCQFGQNIQIPDVILSYNPYCSINASPAAFTVSAPVDPVYISGTACTSCFKIEKRATPGSVTNGIEEVTYEIVVCGNNVPGTYNVDLTDNFPSGFVPTLDPFNGQTIQVNVPYNGCVSTFAGGYLNGDACNHAEMSYTSAQSSILLQADTCIDLLPNCRDISDHVIQNAFTGDIVILSGQTINIVGTVIVPQNVSISLNGITIYFEPGAEILLQSGAQLRLDNCYLLACTKMWKSISLTNNGFGTGTTGSTLSMTDCIVQDAEHAVSIGDYSTAILKDNYFYDNYISVFYKPLAGGAFTHGTALIEDNEFHGTGQLVLPYIGQTTALGSRPKAGIEAWRAMINMTHPRRGQNRFIGLSNGIILQRSDLQIEESWFDDIQPDAVYDNITQSSFGENFNGSGIYGNGFKTNFMVRQKGLGTGSGDPVTFSKCKYGIFVSRMEMESSDNIMDRMTTGYHSRLATRRTIIAQNKINAYETAIELLSFDGANETNVWNNEIIFGHSNGIVYADWAIRAEGNLLGNDRQWINNNTINFNHHALSGYGGIYSNNCRWLKIINNEVVMDDNNNNNHGIYLTNCHNGFTNCNRIYGTADYSVPKLKWQSAITLFDGLDPEIACNIVDATVNGIYVDGTINSLTTGSLQVKGNEINEHLYGLHYSTNATSPAIDYRGNLWLVQNLPSNGKHAINDNNNYIFNYVNSLNLPLLPIIQNPNDWFKYLTGTNDFTCINGHDDYCANNFPSSSNYLVTEPERLAADETLENDPFTEETKWTIKKNLYEKVTDNPSLLGDSLLQQFYINQQGTILAALKPIDEGKSVLFNVDSLQQAWLAAKRQVMDLSTETINGQLIMLDTAIVQQDSAAIAAAITALDNEKAALEPIITSADSLADYIAADRIVAATAIKGSNAALAATLQIEDNEKKVNEIYLATVAKDVFEFTNDQMQELYAIASQCPLAGGQAVYRARSLYALADKNTFFNNFTICEAAGYAMRKPEKTKSKSGANQIKIYPNPANESATLEYNLPGVDEARFMILTTTGQQLMNIKLQGGKMTYTFSTTFLRPGVYQYCLIGNNGGVDNGKLIIVR
jgi:hypothetical protein